MKPDQYISLSNKTLSFTLNSPVYTSLQSTTQKLRFCDSQITRHVELQNHSDSSMESSQLVQTNFTAWTTEKELQLYNYNTTTAPEIFARLTDRNLCFQSVTWYREHLYKNEHLDLHLKAEKYSFYLLSLLVLALFTAITFIAGFTLTIITFKKDPHENETLITYGVFAVISLGVSILSLLTSYIINLVGLYALRKAIPEEGNI